MPSLWVMQLNDRRQSGFEGGASHVAQPLRLTPDQRFPYGAASLTSGVSVAPRLARFGSASLCDYGQRCRRGCESSEADRRRAPRRRAVGADVSRLRLAEMMGSACAPRGTCASGARTHMACGAGMVAIFAVYVSACPCLNPLRVLFCCWGPALKRNPKEKNTTFWCLPTFDTYPFPKVGTGSTGCSSRLA